MTPIRPQRRLLVRNDDVLIVETRPARRVGSGVFLAVLALAMGLNLDVSTDFAAPRLFGTILFLLIMLVLLGAALYRWRMVADRRAGTVWVQRSLGPLELSRTEYPLSKVRGVSLQRTVLLKGTARSEAAAASGGRRPLLGSLVGGRRELVSLTLDVEGLEQGLYLDSSTGVQELLQTARRLSELLGLELREEER